MFNTISYTGTTLTTAAIRSLYTHVTITHAEQFDNAAEQFDNAFDKDSQKSGYWPLPVKSARYVHKVVSNMFTVWWGV